MLVGLVVNREEMSALASVTNVSPARYLFGRGPYAFSDFLCYQAGIDFRHADIGQQLGLHQTSGASSMASSQRSIRDFSSFNATMRVHSLA
jgi:hypothetical protein